MRHDVSLWVVCVLSATLLGCIEQKPQVPPVADTSPSEGKVIRSDGHNAANALDWHGTYEGVVPCADCEGIKTVVTLSKDMTYTLIATYLGKPGKPFETSGTFAWNDAGSTVILAGLVQRPSQYFVGEGYLLQLDMGGKKIEGASASSYRLQKREGAAPAGGTPAGLVGTTWYLKAIQGKDVALEPGEKRPFIGLRSEGSRASGFAGCNTFTGTFEAKDPDRLAFSKLAVTRMMCPDMEIETKFLEALGMADSYAIRDNKLMLHKARMAPLAVFEAGPAN